MAEFAETSNAIVIEKKHLVSGIYKLEDGKSIIANCPITETELKVYKRNPDTFFGVYRKHSKTAETPLDMFDFLFEQYRNITRDKLLGFMEGSLDYNDLLKKTQEELAIIYCERLLYSIIKNEPHYSQTKEKIDKNPK